MSEVSPAAAPVKRFYASASAVSNDGQWRIALDGRFVRTPMGQPLLVDAEPLVRAMAEEWNAQGEDIDPGTMPLNGFANAALDRVLADKATFVDRVVQFSRTDLLCYRADEPADLQAQQHQAWQPLLDWMAAEIGSPFVVTEGIVHVDQPKNTIMAVRTVAAAMNHWELAAFTSLAALLGSVVIAYAVFRGRLSAGQAFDASVLDEMYQAGKWGEDREAAMRRNDLGREVTEAAHFLDLSGTRNLSGTARPRFSGCPGAKP